MDSKRRSVAKAISWRVLATIITTSVVYFSTGELKFAMEIGLIDTTIKLGVYFFHERAWNKVDYGRDAHWLEPFFFGVVAYLIAFLPQSFGLAVNISVVGAISGVVAAGVSHFFLFTVARRSFVPVILSIVAGVIQGMLSGLLFRSFAVSLLFSPLVHGAVAGSLTYLMTSLRGRSLASRESVATSSL